MRDDYRGRMDIWFKTFLLFVVFNKVHLYRQLMNTTCLELAKPSNQHLRLSCNNTSIYHCLLNGNSTNEFEICKMWKWIPEGNCAYLNEYGRNIDARNCSSSAELACPKTLYRSQETIKYAACYVKKNTNSKARQVKNTTCLELAKPSNQQFRLSCNNIGTYHCLLDQSYTKEFEICKMWKWIPKGKCAYFSMYSGGNIDERNCTSLSHYVCPEQKYRSENTTNYSACYIRNNSTTVQPLTSSFPVESNWTSSGGNGGNATSSRISETAEKHIEMKPYVLPSILGIIVPLVSIAVICFILYILRGNQESEDTARNNDIIEQQPFLRIDVKDTSENINKARRNADHVESQESSNRLKNEDTAEKQSFLGRIEMDKTSENSSTMKHEHEDNLSGARLNDDGKEEEKDGKSADSTPGSCSVSEKLDNEREDEEEQTDVFGDTVENLLSIAPPSDEQDRELCSELYNLLDTEGLKLTERVMTASITRMTGKSMKKLMENLTDREKYKLKEILPENSHHIIDSKTENGTSFLVSYGLYRIILDEEKSPKSGWGNPVRGKDIGIGDDVERLNRIQTIVRGISNPVTVSVESYIRLLDIMIEALTRLDPDVEFKEDLIALDKETTCFKTTFNTKDKKIF